MENRFFSRDESWLSFNYRVLLEATDNTVPLLERIKFLSIYSSNLDEFYRIRIPTLTALKKLKKQEYSPDYDASLNRLREMIFQQMKELGNTLENFIIPKLKAFNVSLVYNEPIPEFLHADVGAYFYNRVIGFLQPVMLCRTSSQLFIENNKLHLLVVLSDTFGNEQLAIVNVPTDFLTRFYFIDDPNTDTRFLIFLEDIIKANLDKVFTGFEIKAAYSFKITRDAELDLDDEFSGNLADKIAKQLKKRAYGLATRLLHAPGIPLRIIDSVIDKLNIANANIIAGGNYHNLKDLISVPIANNKCLSYESWPARNNGNISVENPIFDVLLKKDLIVHTPYQSYYPVIRFFNEASIDANVEEIFVTIYRVAHDSLIVNSLISAAKNGKQVTVFVELKARFDEANNLHWARKMKQAGVKVKYSIPGLKVHAKVALIKRREGNRLRYYSLLSTGNFNENTAKFYTDHILFTTNADIVRELDLLFVYLSHREQPQKYNFLNFQHLFVGQFNLQIEFLKLIEREIEFAKKGIKASIVIKFNNLEDKVLIGKLYEASRAGVEVKLIVRSICCLIPGVPCMSENISVIRIVDRYLEHGRIFTFYNQGRTEVFVGSADWMNRNMYHRIEVCFPIYDEAIKKEILQLINIQLEDNVKAVRLNEQMENVKIELKDKPVIRSQKAIYDVL